MMHMPRWIRHDLRDLAVIVAIASLASNFLPHIEWVDAKMSRWPRLKSPVHDIYLWLVDMIAVFALNIREELPSLSAEFTFFYFSRRIKHKVRNWRQERMDRRYSETDEDHLHTP